MHVTFTVKSGRKDAELEALFQRERSRIERRLEGTPPDSVTLHAEGSLNPHLKECYFTLALALPSARMAAHGVGATLLAALRDASRELLRELVRHRAQLARTSSVKAAFRAAVERDGFAAFDALEKPDHEDPRVEIERTLPQLMRFLRAELKRHGLWERRPAYRLDVRELADEAVLAALQRRASKPESLTFSRFLIGCAYDVVLEVEDAARMGPLDPPQRCRRVG